MNKNQLSGEKMILSRTSYCLIFLTISQFCLPLISGGQRKDLILQVDPIVAPKSVFIACVIVNTGDDTLLIPGMQFNDDKYKNISLYYKKGYDGEWVEIMTQIVHGGGRTPFIFYRLLPGGEYREFLYEDRYGMVVDSTENIYGFKVIYYPRSYQEFPNVRVDHLESDSVIVEVEDY